jgi:hypothetical protein
MVSPGWQEKDRSLPEMWTRGEELDISWSVGRGAKKPSRAITQLRGNSVGGVDQFG